MEKWGECGPRADLQAKCPRDGSREPDYSGFVLLGLHLECTTRQSRVASVFHCRHIVETQRALRCVAHHEPSDGLRWATAVQDCITSFVLPCRGNILRFSCLKRNNAVHHNYGTKHPVGSAGTALLANPDDTSEHCHAGTAGSNLTCGLNRIVTFSRTSAVIGASGKPTSAPAQPAFVCSHPAPCFTCPVAFSTIMSRNVMLANRGVAVPLVLFLASAHGHSLSRLALTQANWGHRRACLRYHCKTSKRTSAAIVVQ